MSTYVSLNKSGYRSVFELKCVWKKNPEWSAMFKSEHISMTIFGTANGTSREKSSRIKGAKG